MKKLVAFYVLLLLWGGTTKTAMKKQVETKTTVLSAIDTLEKSASRLEASTERLIQTVDRKHP